MTTIQVFAKPPVAGKVKTRLIPDIGEDKATEVYRYCLSRTLDLVQHSLFAHDVWLSDASDDAIFAGYQCHVQVGENLGDRMLNALNHGPSTTAILVGSDCLDLNQAHFNQAERALQNNDLVLLPCFDGGFAMIACRDINASIFHDVEWSSEQVLAQTLQNAQMRGYRVHLLETVRDIDTLSDLNHYPALRALIQTN